MFNNNNLSALMICMMNHTSLQTKFDKRYPNTCMRHGAPDSRLCAQQLRFSASPDTLFDFPQTRSTPFFKPPSGRIPDDLRKAFGRDTKPGRRPFSPRSGIDSRDLPAVAPVDSQF